MSDGATRTAGVAFDADRIVVIMIDRRSAAAACVVIS
jgi:hypothetical protein